MCERVGDPLFHCAILLLYDELQISNIYGKINTSFVFSIYLNLVSLIFFIRNRGIYHERLFRIIRNFTRKN